MKRTAKIKWQGSLKTGTGSITTESGRLNAVPYSYAMRFGNERGTNPEELIGAAHAACFTMALSSELQKQHLTADTIDVQAAVTLDHVGGGLEITESHLSVKAKVPGALKEQFKQLAQTTLANCPVSKLLKAKVTMDVQLLPETKEEFHSGPV